MRTASLPDLRRWPSDGFFGQKSKVGIPTLVEESRPWRRLGRLEASMPGRRGRVAQCQAMTRRQARLETGTNHFLVAARVEFRVEFRRELRELRSDCSDSCKLRRAKARTQNIAPLCLEGVSQMVYILPERLLALVRPAFDLVLRRIRSLKRCVQACGCKIETPRYAQQFGSRLHFKRCQALPKETPFPFFSGTPFFGTPCFLFFVFS